MAEPRLPMPVRRVLDDSVDDARLSRLWQGLVTARTRRSAPVRRGVLVACAAAILAVASIVFVRPPAPAALHLVTGADVPPKMATGGKSRLAFDDGSTLDTAPGTFMDLLESTPHTFAMAVRTGTIVADVTPGGPRTWRIECGPVTVEVVGTHFTVERAAAFVRVAVARGAVLVRGDAVPDHVVRLGPGQNIVVPLEDRGAVGAGRPPVAPATTPIVASAQEPASPRLLERAAPASSSPSEGTAAAPSASVAAFTEPAAPRPSTMEDGLAAADALRRAGRFADAAAVLEQAIAEHGSDASGPLAEFSLGRLYLDALGDPGRAARHVGRALARGLPSALAEDAQARFVEASARAGDGAAAKSAAVRYHAAYPGGRYASDVDRWASSAP